MQIVQEYERAVIFRLGRLLEGGTKGPGQFSSVQSSLQSYRAVSRWLQLRFTSIWRYYTPIRRPCGVES